MLTLSSWVCMGAFGWLLADHGLLRSRTMWSACAVLAVVLWAHAWFLLKSHVGYSEAGMLEFAAPLSTMMLLLHLPLRQVYKRTFGREPVVDRPPPSIPDFFYAMILFLGPVFAATWFKWA